jgi:hypothetical protein
MSEIPALERHRQGDHEFETSLDYKSRPSLKINKQPHPSNNKRQV